MEKSGLLRKPFQLLWAPAARERLAGGRSPAALVTPLTETVVWVNRGCHNGHVSRKRGHIQKRSQKILNLNFHLHPTPSSPQEGRVTHQVKNLDMSKVFVSRPYYPFYLWQLPSLTQGSLLCS